MINLRFRSIVHQFVHVRMIGRLSLAIDASPSSDVAYENHMCGLNRCLMID